jgi:DNA-binding PadR family transcriptional regulator
MSTGSEGRFIATLPNFGIVKLCACMTTTFELMKDGIMNGPLESTKYLILAALAAGAKHGTAIQSQIVGDTQGVYLRDSTLYSTLKSLVQAELIEETSTGYRRVYCLTEKGRRILGLEARRHRWTAELVGQRLGLDRR